MSLNLKVRKKGQLAGIFRNATGARKFRESGFRFLKFPQPKFSADKSERISETLLAHTNCPLEGYEIMRETTRILTTDFSSILSLGAPGQNFIALALNRFIHHC